MLKHVVAVLVQALSITATSPLLVATALRIAIDLSVAELAQSLLSLHLKRAKKRAISVWRKNKRNMQPAMPSI